MEYSPPVILSGLWIFNEQVVPGPGSVLKKPVWAAAAAGDRISLNRSQSVFSLEFAALSYSAPQKIQYRYMMQGVDKDWNDADSNRRFVTYTRLPPGDYTFRVKSTNSGGMWSDRETILKITVIPAWWQTLWFKILAALSLALAVLAVFEIRMRSIRARNALLEQQVLERTRTISEQARQMELLAKTDPLTGLSNRRDFLEKAEAELARTRRTGDPFAIILCDIDHFKSVNDRYGHDSGDIVLASTADIIRTTLREHDLPARWGGEEFIIMLPLTGRADALQAAERIRARIENHSFQCRDSAIRATMTFGVCLITDDMSLAQCIKKADEALYAGKESGRNRVMVS